MRRGGRAEPRTWATNGRVEGAPGSFRLPQSWLLFWCVQSKVPEDPRCPEGGMWV